MTSASRTGATHWRGRLDAGQVEQRLGVAAHAGGEVVEPEQAGQVVGVGLGGLELGDEVQAAGGEVLVAPAQVDEAVGDVAAQHRLFLGEVERGVLHRVRRCRDVGDLVAGRHLDRSHRGHRHVLAQRGVEDLGHRIGQPPVGHVLGLPRERPQRRRDRQRHQHGQRHRGAERHRHQDGEPLLAAGGRCVEVVGPVLEGGADAVPVVEVGQVVARAVQAGEQRGDVDLARGEALGGLLIEGPGEVLGEVLRRDLGVRAGRRPQQVRLAAERCAAGRPR